MVGGSQAGDPGSPDSFRTLAGPGHWDQRVQRSRFLGYARPIADLDQAREAIAEIARRHHDARHVCYAWRLGVPPTVAEIKNDAGEPSGTAGEPLLVALRKHDVSNALAVVVRYFGGVKLGTGGLARAYGETAEAAIAEAGIRDILLGRRFRARFPYAMQKTLSRLLERYGGRPLEQDYAEAVVWIIWLPNSQWRGFATELTEASAAACILEDLPDSEGPP